MLTSDAIAAYISHCKRRRLAACTIRRYAQILSVFIHFAAPNIGDLSESSLDHYIDEHTDIQNRTLRTHLIIICAFIKWSYHRGYIANNPISADFELPKFKAHIRPSLAIAELTTLLAYCPFNNYFNVRSRTMWTIIALTGIRLSECSHLTLGNITENGLIVIGKGNKTRVVPLPPRARQSVTDYLPFLHWILHRNPDKTDYLFPGRDITKPVSKPTVDRCFRVSCRALGLSGYSVHCLRHTYATLLVRNGVSLAVLQELLGHSSVNSTMVYLHVSAADTTSAALKHPLAN